MFAGVTERDRVPSQRGELTPPGRPAQLPPEPPAPQLPPQPSAEQLRAVQDALDVIPMAAAAHSMDYVLLAANEHCVTLLKLDPSSITGRLVSEFIPAADRSTAVQIAQAVGGTAVGGTNPASALRRLIVGDGQQLTCWMHVGLATIAGYTCFVACIDLVNPVLSDAHRWRHRAEHDELTGLRRRGPVLGQVAQWTDSGRGVILAFLDVDNFKAINDTHGHAAGDHVLTTLARRLEQHASPECVVGRLSGDEFVLARPVPAGAPGDETPAESLQGLLSVGARCAAEPIAWGDHLLMVSMSAGASIGEPGEDPSALLSRADEAMYAQKSPTVRPRH